MLNGALLAIQEFNESSGFDVTLDPTFAIPEASGLSHALRGVVTDKEGASHHCVLHLIEPQGVIPAIASFDALLCYPSHYKGFESSTNVV
jgi:urea transport system substrate-binding protein